MKSAMRIGNRIGQQRAESKHVHNAKGHVPIDLSTSRPRGDEEGGSFEMAPQTHWPRDQHETDVYHKKYRLLCIFC